MFFTLTLTGMHMHGRHWGIVVLKNVLYFSLISLIAHIDIEIFRANIEVLLVTFCKVKSVCVNRLAVVRCSSDRWLFGGS